MSNTTKNSDEARYPKSEILASKKYQRYYDLVSVCLKDGETYTIAEVDNIIKNYLKGKVI